LPRALPQATRTVPIVFPVVFDPFGSQIELIEPHADKIYGGQI
jgi:hypothetical protein